LLVVAVVVPTTVVAVAQVVCSGNQHLVVDIVYLLRETIRLLLALVELVDHPALLVAMV
tara:strand:- start:582 stop:758 length:177 start_codon:yes stop_codon:yes gene_type:complete